MREIFVSELVKDILGPSQGINEIIEKASPLDEYLLGCLIPQNSDYDLDSEESNLSDSPLSPSEDDAQTDEVSEPLFLNPILNPKLRPSSFGISFMVQSKTNVCIDLCLTWARYKKGEDWSYIREPRWFHKKIILGKDASPIFISNEVESSKENSELSLHFSKIKIDEEKFYLTIRVVNEIPFEKGKQNENSIFQPEIRINAIDGTNIIPIEPKEFLQSESIYFKNRKIFARGHLCSATWRTEDPQRTFNKDIFSDEVPFYWIDSKIVPSEIKEKFVLPDVRTIFTPLYSIQRPSFEWDPNYELPVFNAEILSDTWDGDKLYEYLIPIYNGYKDWFENKILNFESGKKDVLKNEIISIERICERIYKGIELLKNDPEARLAFCFSNKVMDTQYRWYLKQKKRDDEPLKWRPYQLAYFLMVIESIVNEISEDRNVCDLLWVTTGAGKTEAYLAIAAFTLAYRRRVSTPEKSRGVGVISRYTLRLLSIQQFRRTLRMITACEYLRIFNREHKKYGWLPKGLEKTDNYIWGTFRFSLGLWVGGNVTPNNMSDFTSRTGEKVYGAISILRENINGFGEPSQILSCPVCNSILAIPGNLENGKYTFNWIIKTREDINLSLNDGNYDDIAPLMKIDKVSSSHIEDNIWVVSFDCLIFEPQKKEVVTDLWNSFKSINHNVELLSVNELKPGYYTKKFTNIRGRIIEYDFEIFCGNPNCLLNHQWHEKAPDGSNIVSIIEFKDNSTPEYFSLKIPISALTVDEQVYYRAPSMIISTVDKFARPAFEERAASLFGNIDHFHKIWGFYRVNQRKPSLTGMTRDGHPSPVGRSRELVYRVEKFNPPDLIIQDELHLLEGPLGSMVGFYETAIDYLSYEDKKRIKYIASTATISNSQSQIRNLFNRDTLLFPPILDDIDDRFFVKSNPSNHPLDDKESGRLYLGIIAPGRGPLTPVIRVWSRLLQTAYKYRDHEDIDPFWTLVGYFNAVRELGGAQALYWQDIPDRISSIAISDERLLEEGLYQELSSRTDSNNLPIILTSLEKEYPDAQDALFTTSMFGTGIDILRFGLMVMHGQPKTTSSYIQATGRVGRNIGALIPVFYRATRPRDLNHYEFFTGYHHQITRNVEPVSVVPFTQSVLNRAAGPLMVYILRNHPRYDQEWMKHEDSRRIIDNSNNTQILEIYNEISERVKNQEYGLTPNEVIEELKKKLDLWENQAIQIPDLRYYEYAISTHPKYSVVLGDPVHEHDTYVSNVFKNAPQSLRELEETTGFQTE
ncbi:MAG: DISARM system helicase DrmA [Promethearchaeota archaeon]